jgi:hypothetical protein
MFTRSRFVSAEPVDEHADHFRILLTYSGTQRRIAPCVDVRPEP